MQLGNHPRTKNHLPQSLEPWLPSKVVLATVENGISDQLDTGFTALGVIATKDDACDINGVLIQVPKEEMPNFDRYA